MPGVSVIVPVYQAEALLEGCVESVRGQTFSDWELLLVDDGSTDASAALCEGFARADPRIRSLRQPRNAGVSEARNRGLQEARGETIAFLDADDRFVPQTLETLWNLRLRAGADTAGCAHWNVSPDGGEEAELLLSAGVYDRAAIRERIALPLFGERLKAPLFRGYIWRYLFSGPRIRRLGLTFQGAYLEDELFLLDYFCGEDEGIGAPRLAVTETPLYRYYDNPNSATRHYMKHLDEVLSGYMDRKRAIGAAYGLDADCPAWEDNSNWAGLLIAVGNEYAHGSGKTVRQRQEAVEALCRRPEIAGAIARLRPEGMDRNKQMVAFLLRRGWFGPLTLLYRLKNRL